jgi:hypothetical protein
MNMKAHYQKVTVPTVFITKDRHRVKQYDKTVYLKDGEEFELELFNPTSKKVLAKIQLNDQYLDSGIILRPGERVFLERYINEARKFIFSTYTVDKNDPNAQEAIKDNGKVEVEFYQEQSNNNTVWVTPTYYSPYTEPWIYNPSIYYSGENTSNVTFRGGDMPDTLTSGGDFQFSAQDYSCEANLDNLNVNLDRSLVNNNLQETGRVEKGSHSNQSFEYDSTNFNSWCSWRSSWTILPLSQKALVKEDIKIFCTKCGAKRKKDSFQFCPHCGIKY